MDYIVFTVLLIIALVLIGSYVRNFILTIRYLRNQDYSLMLVARFFGIFFPVLGIVLGFV